MAMTEIRPQSAPPTGAPVAPRTDVEAVLGTGDHKAVGRLWIALSSLFVLAGLVLGVVAGVERVDLGGFALVDDAEMYAQLWSVARETLIVLGVVPLVIGIATYLVPLQVGASTLAFPRGAAAAFWCWLVSAALLLASYVLNGGVGGGRQDFTSLWAAAYLGVLLGLLWSLVCLLTTIHGLRTLGMTLDRTPLSTWSFFVFGTLGMAMLAVMAAELIVAYVRVRYGDLDTASARLALTGPTDQITLPPGVFWLAIPALGLALEAVTTHTEAPVGPHRVGMGLLAALGVASFASPHLAFLDLRTDSPFDNAILVVQVLIIPLFVLGLLGLVADSIRRGRGRVRFVAALLAGVATGALLLLASLAAVLAQVEPILNFVEDLFNTSIDTPSWLALSSTSVHDGVRVLVVGAALVALVGALHHWGHKIYGRALDDMLGLLAIAALAGGAALWGLAEVVSGMLEQARQPFTTSEVRDGVEIVNGVGLAGAALLALGAGVFLADLVLSTLLGRGSEREPWRGLTLEWATPSPPPVGNFAEPPVVRSRTPLADPPVEEELR